MSLGNLSRVNEANRMIWLLVRRELKVKYRGTILGYLWSMINPLLFMLVISLVFSHMIRGIEDYNLFVLSGLLLWSASSVALHLGTQSIVNSAFLLRKIKLPMWIFPVIPPVSATVNLMLSFIPYLGFFLYSGRSLPESWYLAPVVILATMVFTTGFCLCLASLNVFFRDIQHVLEPLLTLVFYATPVIYDRNMEQIPDNIRFYMGLNPVTRFVEAFRCTIFGKHVLTWDQLALISLLAASSLLIGVIVFHKTKKRIQFRI